MKKSKNEPKVKTDDVLIELVALFILISLTFYAVKTGKLF